MDTKEPPQPTIVKDFLSPNVLVKFQSYVDELKAHNALMDDVNFFNRKFRHNDPFFRDFHHEYLAPMAMKLFGAPVKPSYNFLSCYLPGKGVCPVHLDRPSCYLTIDICLNQSSPWPLYINGTTKFDQVLPDLVLEKRPDIEEIKSLSKAFVMNPGDAVFYSGTHHAHWRKPIENNNFCDLVFFHFVAKDYEGDLY